MKVAFLLDDKDRPSPLWRALSLLTVDGNVEKVSLGYGRFSSLTEADAIVGKDFLKGETSLLALVYPFIIDGDKLSLGQERIYEVPLPNTEGRVLGIGLCERQFTSCVSNEELENSVRAIYPLPFRDCSFDSVVAYEVFDHDVTREAYRVTKRGGRLFLVFRDQLYGGVSPTTALRFVVKFSVRSVTFNDRHWIIEATRTK